MLVAFLKKSSAKNFLALGARVRSRKACAMIAFEKKRRKKLLGIRGLGTLTDYMQRFHSFVMRATNGRPCLDRR